MAAPASSAPAVLVQGVTKTFGTTAALAGVDLVVPEGTVFGLLGPNGAGKTTLVRVLATLLSPDAGRAEVFGRDVVADAPAVRELLGLTGQFAAVDEILAGAGLVRYAGSLGANVPPSLLAFTAAQASTLGLVTGAAALASPFAVQIPILAPAYPARWRWSVGLRATLAFVAGVSSALMLVEIPPSM